MAAVDAPSICCQCTKEILSGQTALQAMEKLYHKDCFKCSECKQPMAGVSFKVVEEKPICNACFEKKNVKKSSGICPICKLDIRGPFLAALDSKFHPDCFNCFKCNVNISKTSFQVKDNHPYCVNCYSELFSPKCFVCSSSIKPSEAYLEVEKHTIHKNCFVCVKCKIPLAGKPFGVKKNAYYCQPHAIKA